MSFRAPARNLFRRPSETASPDMYPVRRDAPRSTSLRIKQQFSIRIPVPRLSHFTNAGGDDNRPGRGQGRTGDMHRYPSIYAPCGIIRVHICKCRDMRGRPSIYAFSGIIRAHISYGITGDHQSGEQMWCSRSFTPPAAAFRMTKISYVQDDKSSGIQNDKRVAVQDDRKRLRLSRQRMSF